MITGLVINRLMLDWVFSFRVSRHLNVKSKDGSNSRFKGSPAAISVRLMVNLSVILVVSDVKTMCIKCRFESRNFKSKNSKIIRNITR